MIKCQTERTCLIPQDRDTIFFWYFYSTTPPLLFCVILPSKQILYKCLIHLQNTVTEKKAKCNINLQTELCGQVGPAVGPRYTVCCPRRYWPHEFWSTSPPAQYFGELSSDGVDSLIQYPKYAL